MIKLIVFSLLGKKLPFAGSIFTVIKAYLIFYLMILPVLLDAQDFEWTKSRPLDFTFNPDIINSHICIKEDVDIYWTGLPEFKEMSNCNSFGDLFIEHNNPDAF